MKILFVLQGILKGGAERITLDMAHALKKSGEHEVVIVALDKRNQYPDMLGGLDVRFVDSFVRLSITGKSIINIAEYEKIVDEFQPDVIHSHTYKAELVSREKPRKNIHYFTHVHSDFPEFEPFTPQTLLRKKQLTKYYERVRMFDRYRQCNNHFITISKAIHENLLRQLPVGFHKNVSLLHNAIDFEKFSRYELPHFNPDGMELISVGRLYGLKNQQFQLKVVKSLLDRGTNCRLTILGDGADMENLKKTARQLNIDTKVVFMGNISNVEDELCKSHIYIHTALKEGFSLSTVEAMAAGLPVVCLDAGGNRDLIEQGRNGYMLSADATPESFADKIRHLYHEAEHYRAVSAFARQFAAGFDIKQYVSDLLQIYRQS
jgi:glycosyltransferase involved in cell wall biosynthesis